MKLLWINNDVVPDEARQRLGRGFFEGVEALPHSLFCEARQIESGYKAVQAKLDQGPTCILADSQIFAHVDGGFKLLDHFKDHTHFNRGAVVSTDLHPALDDPIWNSSRSKFWRFQSDSSSPDNDVCEQILKFLEHGTTSFIVPAFEMLCRFKAAFSFVQELKADECARFVEHWGHLGASLNSSDGSLVPFCPKQAKRWRLFPTTSSELAALGITISRKQNMQPEYQNLMTDWVKILCPFESLRIAANWCPASHNRGANCQQADACGGALRLLCESARRASDENSSFRPPDELLLECDSVQRDWILTQYERLSTKLQAFVPNDYRDLLIAASKEVDRALEILAKYKGELVT
jgi:hypothetical protein